MVQEQGESTSRPKDIKLTSCTVHFTYGFSFGQHLNDSGDRVELPTEIRTGISTLRDTFSESRRPGWMPPYRLDENEGACCFSVFTLENQGLLKENVCALRIRAAGNSEKASRGEVAGNLEDIVIDLREDGVGAVTITLCIDDPSIENILITCLLAPRTIPNSLISRRETTIVRSEYNEPSRFEPELLFKASAVANAESYSGIYRTFLYALEALMENVRGRRGGDLADYYQIAVVPKEGRGRKKPKAPLTPYSDLQTPYIYVVGEYDKDIEILEVEARSDRDWLLKAMAAVIYRWHFPNNIEYVSKSFLYNAEGVRDKFFVNKFVNNRMFSVFTNSAALSLLIPRSERENENTESRLILLCQITRGPLEYGERGNP